MRNFRNYNVWKDAISFTRDVYKLTNELPSSERYGLIDQIRRATVSISSNIAEGCSRTSEKEFKHFVEISLGSAFEVESQIILTEELGFIPAEKTKSLLEELNKIQKQLNTLRNKLK